jgi:hypothetical protein
MARHLGGIAGLAAGVVVASLVLGQILSGRGDSNGQIIALFIVFLVAAFALLAAAVVDSENGVEQLSASPRWSLRAAIRRLGRRVRAAIGRFGRRVATTIHDLVMRVARASRDLLLRVARVSRDLLLHVARATRAGMAWLRGSLTPERRREMWNALEQGGRATLVALGLPPEEDARQHPSEGLDAMPTLPRQRPRHSEPSRHPRRSGIDPLRRTFGPERRRAARDALERTSHRVSVAARGALRR